MTVSITKITALSGSWDGNYPDQKSIEILNKDFSDMDLPLEATLKQFDDGWEIKFMKRTDE